MSNHRLNVNELLYYNKPSIGGNSERADEVLPKEFILPNGKIQIGINVTQTDIRGNNSNSFHDQNVVIVSGPENFGSDYNIRDSLVLLIIVLGFLNIGISSVLYYNLDTIDLSAVMKPQGNENVIQAFRLHDNSPDAFLMGNYALIQIMNILCIVSAIFYSTVGLTMYSLSAILNFIINTPNQPSLAFTLRFIYDSFMVYLALTLRSKLTYNYVVMQQDHSVAD